MDNLAQLAVCRALDEVTLMYSTGFRATRGKQLIQFLEQGMTALCSTARPAQRDANAVHILRQAVDVCVVYLRLADDLFDAEVCQFSQPAIQKHFEAQLKLISRLNKLACTIRREVQDSGANVKKQRMALRPKGRMPPPAPPLPTFQPKRESASTGLLDLLKDASALEESIMVMMRRLMQHVVMASRALLDDLGGTPRDMVLWLMFTANFVNRVLVMLGPEKVADNDEMKSLLDDLKAMEGALPTSNC